MTFVIKTILLSIFFVTAHCSLLTAHCSLLTAHCSLLTAHGCIGRDTATVIEGTVRSRSGDHIVGAEITIAGWNMFSNHSGYFCFEGLIPHKDITIRVKQDGYSPVEQSIEYGLYRIDIQLQTENTGEGKMEEVALPETVAFSTYCRDRL